MQFIIFILTLLSVTSSLLTLQQSSKVTKGKEYAQTIFYNGNIITMDRQFQSAKTVAVKDGKIIGVSNNSLQFVRMISSKTRLINLKKKTMVPGFVDGHSHFSASSVSLNLKFSITTPPFGNVTSIKQMLQNAKEYIRSYHLNNGEPVYSIGYDDYQLEQHRHPTRYQLDWISTQHPIVFGHYSGHAVVANSLALALVGYTQHKQPPPGGAFDKYPNGTLTGLCKEYAVLPLFYKFSTQFSDLSLQQIKETELTYFASGVTTAHEMVSTLGIAKRFKELQNLLDIDINGYFLISNPSLKNVNKFMEQYETEQFKPLGAKIIIDGSIQTYTAYLSNPYWVPKQHQYDNLDNYTYDNTRSCHNQSCGDNNFPYNSILNQLFLSCSKKDYDLLVHCNGDQAVQTFLDGVEYVRNMEGDQEEMRSKNRFIAIHAQTISQRQLDRMALLRANPSFFSPHIYYFGDDHYRIFLGPERANRMNPAKSALKRNISFTLHNDSPVVLIGQNNGRNTFIQIMESAINRKTKTGRILGIQQRINAYEALQAVTIKSAWQARQDDVKGSITVGKMADFVVLSANPLTISPQVFGSLKVMMTIKKGKIVYRRH